MTYNRVTGMGCPGDDVCEAGFRPVSDAYVDTVAPRTPVPHPNLGPVPDPTDPAAPAHLAQTVANDAHRRRENAARAAAARSVFPCPTCNAEQFIRWQGGEWPAPRSTGAARAADGNVEPDPPPPPEDDLFSAVLDERYR